MRQTHRNDCSNPREHKVVLSSVGLLTHHRSAHSQPSRPWTCHSPGDNGSFIRKERRLRSIRIAGGTQRPDRPGISPEFPVTHLQECKRATEDGCEHSMRLIHVNRDRQHRDGARSSSTAVSEATLIKYSREVSTYSISYNNSSKDSLSAKSMRLRRSAIP